MFVFRKFLDCGVIDELLFVLQYEESAPVTAECVLALETVGSRRFLRYIQFIVHWSDLKAWIPRFSILTFAYQLSQTLMSDNEVRTQSTWTAAVTERLIKHVLAQVHVDFSPLASAIFLLVGDGYGQRQIHSRCLTSLSYLMCPISWSI